MINVLIVLGILFYALIGYGTGLVLAGTYKRSHDTINDFWLITAMCFWPIAWVFIFVVILITLVITSGGR